MKYPKKDMVVTFSYCWCVPWLVPRHSWRRFLSAISRHSWLGFAVGGGGCSSPLLAEGLRCGSPPLLARVRWRRWCVVACHSWLRVPVAVPRHSWLRAPLVVVVAGPLPLLAEGLGGGSPPLLAGYSGRGGGCFRGWGFPVLCVLVAQCVRVVSVLVCVVCVRGVCVGGGAGVGVPSACVCVCVCPCVCGVLVACGVLRRGVLVEVWLVRAVVGASPLLAEVPMCDFPPLVAGFRCRWWWLLAEGPGCVSLPILARVLRRWWCAAHGHSWLGPAGCGGVFRGWGCPLLCVFVVCVGARGGRAVLCVACWWCPRCWWCGVVVRWVCLPRALVCAVACVWCAGGLWFVVPASFG